MIFPETPQPTILSKKEKKVEFKRTRTNDLISIFKTIETQVTHQNNEGALLDPNTVGFLTLESLGKLSRARMDAIKNAEDISSVFNKTYVEETIRLMGVLTGGLRHYLDMFDTDFGE